MRPFVIIAAYLAASSIGGAVLGAYSILFDTTTGRLIDALGIAVISTLFGAGFVAPIAVPLIIATEAMRRGPWWLFLGGGVAAAAFLLWMLIPDLETTPTLLALTICPFSALTYWFIAWHRYPPKALFEAR